MGDVILAKVNVEGSSPFARSKKFKENGQLESHLRLGAPQDGLALAIWRMSALSQGEISSCAGVRGRDFQRQNKRKPARCQRTTVSGLTTTGTSAQRDQRWESTTQKARSLLRRRGRAEVRWKLASCWRRARFSTMRSAWVRSAALQGD